MIKIQFSRQSKKRIRMLMNSVVGIDNAKKQFGSMEIASWQQYHNLMLIKGRSANITYYPGVTR